ncbi:MULTISPECIES: helix-turn-helix domain-containing protein [unclassified Dietzia]|uniref:winged helix-turn-helix transcriptional regulator n=1 Tax=unclassified Dietzia TaxID=2617939 RepID=UPI000D222D7B|nr:MULTISPECIES: helix-turn-helix domain-containing protein [unclassified Dietzia]AVZ40813.1 transcriptional regulator [Dietzia sp. JS16-p6b]QGW26416.1 putative transcriptional regulator [Dietzia sp. DQ12-45-1b]
MKVSQGPVRLASAFGEGVYTENCPTRAALSRVTSRWAPLLLAALSDDEPLRWNELRHRASGITDKMLSQTLRVLEADGYVHREARPVVPPHVEYSLTPDGVALTARLLDLMTFVSTRELGTADEP